MDLVFLKVLRLVAFIEGCSTLILFFVAMPLKYWFGISSAVTWAGSVHGFLFLGLVTFSLMGIWKVPTGILWGIIGIIAAIIPFGPFLVDYFCFQKLEKRAAKS